VYLSQFYSTTPSLDNYWRAIVLFGRNVASYKFALSLALSELATNRSDLVKLEDLAEPFSRHLCTHLKHSPKQITSRSSKFLEACKSFNGDKLTQDALIAETVKSGFNNVIDAFHIVNGGEVGVRFFLDERTENKGIRLTDDLNKLFSSGKGDFPAETEARWRLVETAWALGLSRHIISVANLADGQGTLVVDTSLRRRTVTSCRNALVGYQKGLCFYCYTPIKVRGSSPLCADVDHFFPHTLKGTLANQVLDGVWNLVLACKECNRGEGGKHARVPSLTLLERLRTRNDYLIASHHPLRETLKAQTGMNEALRRQFLQRAHTQAKTALIHEWEPTPKGPSVF